MENISRVTARGQITIPKEIREKLGIKKGNMVSFRIEGNKIIIQKVEIVIK